MKIVKSLGLKGIKNSFKKQELLLLKCECGVLLKQFKEAFNQRPKKNCGYCSIVPSIVMGLEERYLAKGCEVVAFKISPKENTNHAKWLEIIYEQGEKICKTKVSYQNKDAGSIINGVEHWSSPWNKKEESGTPEHGENQSQLKSEELPMQKEREEVTESRKENEGEIMSNGTDVQSESPISQDTTEPPNLSLINTEPSGVSAERSLNTSEAILKDVSLINESARHLYNVMTGLTPTFNNSMAPTNAVKIAEAIVDHVKKDVGIVQAKINCAKEIKNLLSLKLDYAKFASECLTKKRGK